jgi:prepilin-type N-terminal cleavage/methylation domain-containing protein
MLRPSHFTRRSGLTLIEVMVALGVLVILVGGIFMVVQTSLKTVLMIDNSASREDEITNLTDILRAGFRNLPPNSGLTGQLVEDGGVKEYLIIVRNAPGFLTWMSEPESEKMIVLLSLRQDGKDASWRVCMKRFVPNEKFPEDNFDSKRILQAAADVPWLELVADFQRVNARFFDVTSKDWKDRWVNSEVRPALIEFTLVCEQVRDVRSETKVLWIPPVRGGTT